MSTPSRICSICQHSFEDQDLAITRCRHAFHRACILDWLSRSSTCPLCRVAVTRNSLMEYYLPPPTSTNVASSSGAIPKTTERILYSRSARKRNNDANRNLSFPPESDSAIPPPSILISPNQPTFNPEFDFPPASSAQQIVGSSQMTNPISNQNSVQNSTNFSGASASIVTSAPSQLHNHPPPTNFVSTASTRPNYDFPPAPSALSNQNIEHRILSAVQSRMESEFSRMNALMVQMSQQLQNLSVREPEWPQEQFPPLSSRNTAQATFPQNQSFQNIDIPRERPSNVSSVAIMNSSKVANLINNWHLTFSGASTGMTVEKFIYMVNSLVSDSLAGDFNLLSEHSHLLFTGKAKDWYWRYRRTVPQIQWNRLCVALQGHFNDHLSDLDIRELVRERKQNFNESFEDFYTDILQICDRLRTAIPDHELIEIVRRNVRPHMRKELFYLEINSLAELRSLVLRREALAKELDLTYKVPKRNIHEIDPIIDDSNLHPEVLDDVNEFVRNSDQNPDRVQGCFNCKSLDHRYKDCMAPKTVFCFGCGKPDVFRPKCPRCNPGNLQSSSSNNTSLRSNRQ